MCTHDFSSISLVFSVSQNSKIVMMYYTILKHKIQTNSKHPVSSCLQEYASAATLCRYFWFYRCLPYFLDYDLLSSKRKGQILHWKGIKSIPNIFSFLYFCPYIHFLQEWGEKRNQNLWPTTTACHNILGVGWLLNLISSLLNLIQNWTKETMDINSKISFKAIHLSFTQRENAVGRILYNNVSWLKINIPIYKCQTYRNSHLFGKSVSPCIFLILIYTDQEHTGTHTFSKYAGKVSDLKRCEFLYVLATHVIWSGTYKNLHLFKILWKQSYQFRCESLYVPCLYI